MVATFMGKPTVLFDGTIGTQSVHVWLEWRGGDMLLSSQELGPALEPYFGEAEIEVFLTVEAAQLPQVARALGCRSTPRSIEAAMVERFRGDSSATSHLMALVAENAIPYEFYSV